MIRFGISKNYVPNWGMVQAIREIYQNFIDYGDYNIIINKISDTQSSVRISNYFDPHTWEFLKFGFSKKNETAIGKHGEGLKLAGLIFLRNDNMFRIHTGIGRASAVFYNDENLGECYGLKLHDITNDKFEIYFEANTNDINFFTESRIQPKDIKHTSSYGSIVDKPQGSIYIGGLYVCKIKNLKYAIDFKPWCITLGRDREVPSSYDIEYYTGHIISECQKDLKIRASDIHNKEFSHGSIPNKLVEKFKPVVSKNGHISMVSGATVVTNSSLIKVMMRNPIIAKRIEKYRQTKLILSKKTPNTLLKELLQELNLNTVDTIKFNTILKLSKNWKN